VLLVSHNVAAVLNLCRQAILLEGGRMIQFAKVDQVVSQYLATNRQYNTFLPAMGEELGDRRAKTEHFEIRPTQPQTGMPLEFMFTISNNSDREKLLAELSVSVLTQDGARLLQLYSRHMGREFELPRGRVQITARVESLPLAPGNYTVNLWLGIGNTPFHWLRGCFVLSVAPGCLREGHFVDFDGYPVLAPTSWQMCF
jgi:lipopolysaccharide transport system ATP-binding protein